LIFGCSLEQTKNTCLLHFVYYVLGAIVLLSLAVYLLQERFIFKPEKPHQNFQFKYDVPFKELFFDIQPGVRINGLHFYRERNPKD